MNLAFLHDHPEFVPALSDLCGREWAHFYPDWNAETARREFESQPGDGTLPVTLVAVEDGELLGTVSLIFDDLPGFEHLNPWLANLIVLPAHRGKLVASFLIRAAEERLRTLGYSEGFLFTESARQLFEKLGWTVHGPAACGGSAVTVMRKTLFPIHPVP